MAWGLDDGEEWFTSEAEAPFGGIDGAGDVCGPGFLVKFGSAVEELPEELVVLLNGAWVGGVLGEEHEGSVGAHAACLG